MLARPGQDIQDIRRPRRGETPTRWKGGGSTSPAKVGLPEKREQYRKMAAEQGGEVSERFDVLRKMWGREDGSGVCEMACYYVARKNSLVGTLCGDTKKGGGKGRCKAHPDKPCCMGVRRGELQLPEGGELSCVFPSVWQRPEQGREKRRKQGDDEVCPIVHADSQGGLLDEEEPEGGEGPSEGPSAEPSAGPSAGPMDLT